MTILSTKIPPRFELDCDSARQNYLPLGRSIVRHTAVFTRAAWTG